MATIFDLYTKEKIEKIIEEISSMLEEGAYKPNIIEHFDIDQIDEIFSIAVARKKAKTKGFPDNLYLNEDDLRFATPKNVADYRAKRLKCDCIADLGCSIGMQSFSFAKTCKKIYAVEIDERKHRYAKENAKILGIKNVEFIRGDILEEDVIKRIIDANSFFCDPERLAEESERKLDTILPNPKFLLEKYPKNIAIEFPPQISKIDLDCEKEFLSVNGHLNRLTLYFGSLKKTAISVIALPSEERVEFDGTKEFVNDSKKGLPLEYLYEVDTAIVKAGMFWQIAKLTKSIPIEPGILTSEKPVKNSFFKSSFKVIDAVHHDFDSIVHCLEKHGVGKVVIRYKILPQDYWKERTKYEKYLKGEKTVHLFLFEKAVIAEKI